MDTKKALRTLQIHCPALLDVKFSVMRAARRFLQRPFERDFSALALFDPPPGALCLDVGANRGQSVDAILMVHPGARVHAFEPNGLLHERLSRLYAREDRVRLYDFGLGDSDTTATLYVPFYKDWMFDGLASFDEDSAAGWLQNRIYFYRSSNLHLEALSCRIKRLDDLQLAPFFIKIDVQGYEERVLEGGRRTIERHRPVLLIEAPGDGIIGFLSGFGYLHCAYRGNRLVKDQLGHPNTFFVHPDSPGCQSALTV